MSAKPAVDVDLQKHQVQDLSSPDAVAAFFAGLGWDTSARTPQTPANLGVGAQTLLDQIKHCELIADHEELLQVYLFELTSLTVSATRGLARAFRNRAGNFLLVLTADYEHIDFVLLERFVPEGASPTATIGRRTADIRPRILSVERRNPGKSKVEMRVLRRFTYTAGDPVAQYDKLVSAYGIAEWSEEHFDNRNLFADYYLSERLPDSDQWKQESPKDAYSELSRLYENAAARWANKTEGELRSGLLEPALRALGFDCVKKKSAKSAEPTPDYVLCSPENGKVEIGACLTYPWDRNLDGKDEYPDREKAEQNPGYRVVSLLHRDDAQWVIVTNGKHWRLYSPRTHAKATNYYEIDLEETLASPDPQESFRYFWFLFRRQAFEPRTIEVDGEEKTTTYLDQLVEDSQSYAKRLGDRLKDRVFDEVFIHLARGFVEHRKAQQGAEADLSQEALDEVFHGTLTLLYRLLFLLYAEARDLLPVRNVRDYYAASLKRMKEEIGEAAGKATDKVEERLKRAYRADATDLYARLTGLFRIIDEGEPKVNVPEYNGGLFISKPDAEDETPEAKNARFLISNKVPDRYVAMALDLLARDEDEKTDEQAFIDYKSLGVRQLGSIYEGLLEFHLRIAPEKMAICKGKKTEEVYPYKEAVRAKRQILKEGRGQNAKERTYRKGDLYLENTRGERKATGSYYTPDYIVKYIVEHTVGPVLEEKFDAVRPRLREAQKAHAAAVRRNKELKKVGMGEDDPEKVANEYRDVVDELFDVKVLDPAMGSGHFLVEAVDVISDRMIAFLNGFPWNPVTATLGQTRQAILKAVDEKGVTIDPARLTDVNLLKRHVLKRCVYGVDLNPMAVELAKVSLWLHCFTLGAPLSFLDHHLRCGNSLIGTQVTEVQEALQQASTGKAGAVQFDLLGGQFAGLMLATEAMRKVAELSDVTPSQVARSRAEYRSAEDALVPFKRILDVYLSQWFGNKREVALELLRSDAGETVVRDPKFLFRMRGEQKSAAERAFAEAAARRFFHWELEFAEVWYTQGRRRESPGFDAVVGNPPWLGLRTGGIDEAIVSYAKSALDRGGQIDLAALFLDVACDIVGDSGWVGAIVPKRIATNEAYESLRRRLSQSRRLESAIDLDVAFEEVNNDVIVLVSAPGISPLQQCFFGGRAGKEVLNVWPVPNALASQMPFCIFPVNSTTGAVAVTAAVARNAVPFGEGSEIVRGAECGMNHPAISRRRTSSSLPLLDHLDVRRYEVVHSGWYVDPTEIDPGVLKPVSIYRKTPKLVIRFLASGLVCGRDDIGCTSTNLLYHVTADMELSFLLSVLSSSLLDLWYRTGFQNEEIKFPHVQKSHLVQIPTRRIHFTTPARERAAMVKELKGLCRAGDFDNALAQIQRLLPQNDEGNFLAFQDGPNWKYDPETKMGVGECPEKSDVVHDFLAFLAEQMIEMNKEKQAEMQRFLGWLEEKLRISPDRQEREGIDALTGKTKLRNYLGDYQKGEKHLSFDEFLTILRKNRSRIGAGLSDPAFVERLRTEFESSLAKLLPIKERLAKTDWLIDQVVYRLYGLTEEEINIVEGGSRE